MLLPVYKFVLKMNRSTVEYFRIVQNYWEDCFACICVAGEKVGSDLTCRRQGKMFISLKVGSQSLRVGCTCSIVLFTKNFDTCTAISTIVPNKEKCEYCLAAQNSQSSL